MNELCVIPFDVAAFGDLWDSGSGSWDLYAIPVALITVLLPFTLGYLIGDTQDSQWPGLVCLWLERSDTKTPGPCTSDQRMGWSGASGDTVCIAPETSVSLCMGTVIISEPGKEP